MNRLDTNQLLDRRNGAKASKAKPSCLELASSFAWITMIAFGGGAPWVKRIAVDDRRWLTLEEFAEVVSLSQSLPGAVFFNLAVTIGMREQGVRGALSTLAGVLLPALIIGVLCERLDAQIAKNVLLHRILGGVVAAAAGLFASTCIQTSCVTWQRLGLAGIALSLCVIGAILGLHLALPLVVCAFVPLGMLLAWYKR